MTISKYSAFLKSTEICDDSIPVGDHHFLSLSSPLNASQTFSIGAENERSKVNFFHISLGKV